MNTFISDQNCESAYCDYRVNAVATAIAPFVSEQKDQKLKLGNVNAADVPQTIYISSKDLVLSGSPSTANGTFYGEVKLGPKSNVLYTTVSFFSRINVYADAKLDMYKVPEPTLQTKNVNVQPQRRQINVFNQTKQSVSAPSNADIEVPLNRASAFDDMEVTYHQNSFLGTCVGRFISYPKEQPARKLMLSGIEVLPAACNPPANKEFMYWGNPNQDAPATMKGADYPLTYKDIGKAGALTVNGQKVLLGNYYKQNGDRASLIFADPDQPCDTFLVDAKVVEKPSDSNAYLKLEFKNGSQPPSALSHNTVIKININH